MYEHKTVEIMRRLPHTLIIRARKGVSQRG
jgi:hypothetical protein